MLVFAVFMALQTDWAQNYIIQKVTRQLSKDLNTKVSIKHVSLRLFDKLSLDEVYIEDQKKDTLLYAGHLKVNITDWFFLKKNVIIQYIGLEDAVVNLNRKDPKWNYQFIVDAFSTPDTTSKPSRMELYLRKLDLKNVQFAYRDSWIGQDLEGKLRSLVLDADTFQINKKYIRINSLNIDRPYFSIYDYTGKRPDSLRPNKFIDRKGEKGFYWNNDGWDIEAKRLSLRDGTFRSDIENGKPTLYYFDPEHIAFGKITGTVQDFSFKADTIWAKLDLSTKERCGFTVNKLKTKWKFIPGSMEFHQLDIRTPFSRLRDFYAMRYGDLNRDMSDYIGNVRMEAKLSNSTLGSEDIAYFAPELEDFHHTIGIDGTGEGSVEDINAKNIHISFGDRTLLNTDVHILGLPDVDNTLFEFTNTKLITNHTDAQKLIPQLQKIKGVDLAALNDVRYTGEFRGYLRSFYSKGLIESSLGNLQADAKMRLPEGRKPIYDGKVASNGFDIGRLLDIRKLGKMAFDGTINGSGFETSGAVELDGKIFSIEYNKYAYKDITVRGTLQKKEFNGTIDMDDPNARMGLRGYLNLNDSKQSEINVTAIINNADLKKMNFTNDAISILGKFKLNLLGNDIDDFIGEASLYDVGLTKNDETFIIDHLNVYSSKIDDNRLLELKNDDIDVSMNGNFKLSQVPQALKTYLRGYYPTYFYPSDDPLPDQEFTVKVALKNFNQYARIFDKKLSGFDYSSMTGRVNTAEQLFEMDLNIPQVKFGKYQFDDFKFIGRGNLDSLKVFAKAGTIVVNDSLQFPSSTLSVISAGDISDIELNTFSSNAINAASLSARITHLNDGLKVHFNPSNIVLNQKTWKIEQGGEVTITRSVVDASEFRLVNGDQRIAISTIPSEIGNSHDIIVDLHRVNLGDLLPFVFREPRIQGITSGELTIEDPLNKLKIYLNAQTEQTRFENDSIGITTLNGYWDNKGKFARFSFESENPNYEIFAKGRLDLDSAKKNIDIDADIQETRVTVLQTYLSDIFSKLEGKARGHLKITGNPNAPDIVGSVKITGASATVGYTNVNYKLNDPTISFGPGYIDLGQITIRDEYGNTGMVSGNMKHQFFNDMYFDIKASTKKLLILNTTKFNNDVFYGRAIARANFSFTGPENNMRMYVNGEPVDSSRITIMTTATSKQSSDVDYIVWKQYGREMNADSIRRSSSALNMDLDFSANPLLNMVVVLDEMTGDSITAYGSGNMKIQMGTNEPLVMNGRYNIDRGKYNFNFQEIFKKPFVLEQGSGSYISWSGDPYNAELNINATYTAEKVRMSTLFETGNNSGVSSVSSDLLREISDVTVLCNIGGTMNAPQPSFELRIPTTSTVKNNPTVDNKLKTINRDQNEASKQATYLIVFKSFAPQTAIVTNNLNSDFLNSTLTGVINGILSNTVQNFFYKLFGSNVDVNFNYSRIATNLAGNTTALQNNQNMRENVSLQFIKTLVNNRLIISLGSDFNFNAVGTSTVSNQSFLFLPDVNVEYKITPDGKFRTSFFYRSSFDVLSSSGKRDRTGGNFSFRTEFDHLFKRKKAATDTAITKEKDTSMR